MKCQPNMNDVQWFLLAATAQQSHVHIFIMDFRLLASFCFIVVRINVWGATRLYRIAAPVMRGMFFMIGCPLECRPPNEIHTNNNNLTIRLL